MEEARRILNTAANVRNGARFVVALTVGLRRGEALGMKWSDLDTKWRHGCEKGSACRGRAAQLCPDRQLGSAMMTIRRAVQQFVWQMLDTMVKHRVSPGQRPIADHGVVNVRSTASD